MEGKIIKLDISNYSKCNNIWNMDKDEYLANKFYNELKNNNRITFVYVENDNYLGEVSLVFDMKDNDYTIKDKRIYLSRLIVKEGYRNKGIGKQLLNYVFEYALNLGYKEITVGVDIDNYIALALYVKFGFTIILYFGEDDNGKYFKLLKELKPSILINRYIDKEPYIKNISNDKVINLTGESGSGKTTYSNKYFNNDNYIVIDTDLIFNNGNTNSIDILNLRELFKDKTKDILINNFDECYLKILDYFKGCNKTIVIDSAQFRNIKNYSILKGTVIVIRTSIETCYERVINRWIITKNNIFTNEEYDIYTKKKLGMFTWYKSLNEFIININKL